MGRKPKPTELKRLAGNPGRRPLNDAEPTPTAGVPHAPAWLGPDAKKHWKQLAPMLSDMGVLTKVDGLALALLCEPLVRYIEARILIEAAAKGPGETKFIATTDKGTVYQHPLVGVMNKAWEQAVKMAREFGLTPSSRSGLHADLPQEPTGPLRIVGRDRSA